MRRFAISLVGAIVLTAGWLTLALGAESTVGVRIEGSAETVFAGKVGVDDCTITDNSGAVHELSATAVCALQAALETAGAEAEFQDFGFGLLLQRIGDDSTPADWSSSWSFWANDDMADVGMDAFQVSDGDDLLFAFAPYPALPLRVQVPSTAVTGETMDLQVQQRLGETDENWQWHGRWEEAPGATVHVGEEVVTADASGLAQVELLKEGQLEVWATGEGWVTSNKEVITVGPSATVTPSPSVSPMPSSTPEPTVTPVPVTPTPTPTCAPVAAQEVTQAVNRGLLYLRQQQQKSGMIDGPMVSAWSAMAFGSANVSSATVQQGDTSLLEALLAVQTSLATDVERQILAARATGANPKKFGTRDLMADLQSFFDGQQYGATSLINDDIFALLALLAGGEKSDSANVSQTVQNIMAAQESSGLWNDSADLTAAAMQALAAYDSFGGDININESLVSGRKALLTKRDKQGGFGNNSATTAWVSQALLLTDNNDLVCPRPLAALLEYQNEDGGFSWQLGEKSSPLMTAYAVPALLTKTWPIMELEDTSLDVITDDRTYAPGEDVLLAPKTDAATPKATPQIVNTGQVAGVKSEAHALVSDEGDTEDQQSQEEEISGANDTGAETKRGSDPPDEKPIALLMFSIANMGIGISLTRLLTGSIL